MLNIKLLVRKSLRASKFLFLGTIIICSLFSHVLSNIFHLVSSIEPYPDGNTEPIVQTNEKDTQALPLFHKVTTDNDLQPVVPQNLPFSPEYDLEAKYDSRTPLYTDHVPIKILNDSAFGPTFYNFTGSGTPAQPYLIDGYNITDSSGDLIHIENTTACFRISNNLLNGLYDVYNQHICGIKLVNVTYGLIDGNEITNTGDEAIYLEYSNNTTILNNKIYNCSGSGISLSDANNITMYGNSIYNSSIYGIFLNKSTNDTVIWTNTFQNNNVSNAFDNSTGANFWDNGTHGNWWDDYTGVDPEQDGIGNIPYNISGEAGAQDRYPLMEIYVVITTTPVSLNGTQGIPFFFDFNVSAPYSEILTWFLAGNCTSWLTINDSTGEISGIPSYNSMGTWNVTVSVIDENSASDIYMVFLSVQIVTIFFTEVTSDQNMFLFDIIQLYVRVETDAGKPAEGVAVEWWQGSTFLGSNTTNSTGYSTWTLQLTTAETYHIQAKIPARSLQVNISLPTEAMEFWFNGIDNETEPIQLTIGTNYTISGKLVDSTGDPISGVEVVFVIDDLQISPISAVIDGWVNTTHLFSTEGTYTITATKNGLELPIGEDRAELTVYVSVTSVIVAFITPSMNITETVKGVPTSFVGWIYFDEDPPISAAGIRVGLLVNGTQVDSLFSNKNGYVDFSYTFPNTGSYRVAFYYNEQSWGEIWVIVTAGYFASLIGSSTVNGTIGQELEFSIYVLSNASTFYQGLKLVRNDGTPVIGAQVDWYINNAYQNTTKTGLGGRTSFSYIFNIHGFYRVVAKHESQILAIFEVTISEKTKDNWEKFIEDNMTLLTILTALFCIFLVMGAIPRTRREIGKALKRIQALITRKTVFGPKYCARVLASEFEEKMGKETLQAAVVDPSKLEPIRREVSAKLTRFNEFMTKTVNEKVEFTQKTTELILKRYKK